MESKCSYWVLTAVVLLLVGCSPTEHSRPAVEGGRTELSSVVIALKPDKNPDQMQQEKSALEALLSNRLHRPVRVIVPLSSSVIMEGFVNGTVDLGYLSATDMIYVREKGAVSILLAGEIDGAMTYQSYWLALKDKPYSSVEDLRGQPVAFASRTSTSGYLVPYADLVRKGLLAKGADPEEYFGHGNVWYGSGYVSAVERVLSGDMEAAAVSDYVFDEGRHLSDEQRSRLKKVTEQGPVPTHVIAVRMSIPAAERQLLKDALLSLNEPEHHALRDAVFTSKLVATDEQSHLAPLHDALQLTGRL